MKITSETGAAVTGSGDDGRFELRLHEAVVTSVEGLPAKAN
jgi:hypothetical protein